MGHPYLRAESYGQAQDAEFKSTYWRTVGTNGGQARVSSPGWMGL